MKNFITTTLLSILSFSAFSSERIVVSFYDNKNESVQTQSVTQSKGQQCFDLSNQNVWCVPAPTTFQGNGVNTQSSTNKNLTVKSFSFDKPAEISFEQAQSLLESTGLYLKVEKDFQIKSNWNTSIPNDPSFGNQNQFLTHSNENPTSSSILDMWNLIQNPTKNIDIYVLDTGFRLNDDLNYADGFNFTVVEFDNERGTGFLEEDFHPKEGDPDYDPAKVCTNQHGLMVGGIIGAEINNNNKVSGIVGDATIHPIRVMNCGAGFLSDVTATLNWLSGETIEHVPDFTGEAGVVNMSLGGNVGGACPFYIQSSVDKAIAAGFVLVASAGNDNVDVSTFSPANCNGVITAGAMNDAKVANNVAEKAGFSNFGQEIDITAQGVNVSVLLNSGSVGGGSGTSFSGPIVAALIALAQKDFTLTPAEWLNLVSISGIKSWATDSQCALLGCGNGVLDGVKLYENVGKYLNGELNSMDYSLNALSTCNQDFVIKHVSSKSEACDQVTVSLNGFNEEQGVSFSLYTVEDGLAFNEENRVLLTQSDIKEVLISKNSVTGKTVYVQSCSADFGCGEFFEVDSSKLAELPNLCL